MGFPVVPYGGYNLNTKPYTDAGNTNFYGSFTTLNFSLLGKYPFIFRKFSIFPLLGIDYKLFLSSKIEVNYLGYTFDNASDLNTLWFNLGAGGDFSLAEKFYIRGELLYGFRLPNKLEKDLKDSTGGITGFGHRGIVKIAADYKF